MDDIDDSYDSDFPRPHLDDPRINDLPAGGKWIGKDKVIVKRHTDYGSMARGNNYPWDDGIDYDPRFDEDLEEE